MKNVSSEGANKTLGVDINVGKSAAAEDGSQAKSCPPIEDVSHLGTSKSSEPAKGKWLDLFTSNRSFAGCPKLMHISEISSAKNCTLLDEDLNSSCDVWNLCIVGYVVGKFPGYKALNSNITNT